MSYTNILRTITSSLQEPVIILLLLLIAVSIFLIGSVAAEIIIEKRCFKVNGRTLPIMVDKIHKKPENILTTLKESKLLRRHKVILYELTLHKELPNSERESLAVRLIEAEQARFDRRIKVTDLISKIGPMLGLMGTLIPLGPGIIALGQGDTMTLSNSLLVAFDTTVAGLACAFIAMIISMVRKIWYRNYMSVVEMLAECILEEEQV